MDPATISTAFSGIKFAKDAVSAILDFKIENEAQNKVHAALKQLGDVQDNLFSLREQLFELQTKNQELQTKLDSIDQWTASLSRYETVQASGGAVVLGFKENPKHFACPSCANKKQIEILQDSRNGSGLYQCPSCKSNYPINPRTPVQPIRVTRA